MVQLRYISPVKSSLKAALFIAFFAISLFLYLTFVQYGAIVIIIFSAIYIVFMTYLFFSLKNERIEIDEERKILNIHKLLSFYELPLADITVIDIRQDNHSYKLFIETKDLQLEFILTGALYSEEPPIVPFIKTLHDLKPDTGFGDKCISILHGEMKITPWSINMFYTYWSYVAASTTYFLLLLLFLKLLS